MGYYATIRDCNICIPAASFTTACQHLLATGFLVERDHMMGSAFDGKKIVDRWYSWVDMGQLEACLRNNDLVGVFECFAFTVEVNEGGDIVGLGFDSKVGNEQHLLSRLASFFGAKDYIAWRGEDAEFWVTCFRE